MKLGLLDSCIILGYLLLTFIIGFVISRRSVTNLDGYFLGNNKIKWWMLGLSNSSGMFDVNAVSWRLALLLMYGIQSVWIPWVWPVWNQVFVMIFLSTWLRRSGAMTGAEWMRIRFGDGLGGKLSHIIVVIFAVVEVMISIGVFFTGIGGLAAELLPNISIHLSATNSISSKTLYAIILCMLTTIYSIKGGIYSIVATEVLQFIILTICCFVVIYLGLTMVSATEVKSFLPQGWLHFWPKQEINYNWPTPFKIIENESVQNGFKMIAGMVGLMIGKGMVASLAGPVPGFDMQRSLSSQTPKDAAKMSGFTILVLFIPLYLMVGGFALLAIKHLPANIGGLQKVEQIFNILVQQLPVGVKGLVIAGLLAAFMSVFSAFVNVAPAYLVNDLYKRYFQKNKPDNHYVSMGRWVSIAVVVIGILIGTQITSLNNIILFVTGAFYGGYAAPNVLKWIWWRFNGYGYFAGMLSGMFAAMVGKHVVHFIVQYIPALQALANTQAVNLMAFVFIFIVSILGCIIGCLCTQPVEEATTIAFYKKTRPWGFWKPIIAKVQAANPAFKPNLNFNRDAVNVLTGIVWQMSMVVMPLYLAFRQWQQVLISLAVLLATSILLKFNWYNKLEED
jgi:solute:Na+ symporter, SSS family